MQFSTIVYPNTSFYFFVYCENITKRNVRLRRRLDVVFDFVLFERIFRAYCINTQNNTLSLTKNIQKNMPNRMSKYGVLWRGDRILKGTKMCFHKRNFIQTHFA